MPDHPNPKLRPPPTETSTRVESCEHAYAELCCTTNYSFLRGASHPDELIFRAAELGYRALAVTDFNTLAGVVRAHEAAKQCGMKLIVGARLTLVDCDDLLLWPTDRAAYGRLCRLLTLGKRRVQKGECALDLNDVIVHSAGMHAALLPLPCRDTRGDETDHERLGRFTNSPPRYDPDIPRPLLSLTHDFHEAEQALHSLRRAMGDRVSLAVARPFGPDDQSHLLHMQFLSRQTGVPLLATNEVYYHDPSRRPLHDVLACVKRGCTIDEAGHALSPHAERHLKPPDTMHRIFADVPEAIERGIRIAGECTFSLDDLKYEYPHELVPEGMTPIGYLTSLTSAGAVARYPAGVPDKVTKQIRHELILIEELKIEPYFLTVYDLVLFARSRDILCQGRGSAANSAVCYCLGVTSVDPDQIDILFERFVSRARNEPPDIDIDFEHERREEVIQYLYNKYGRERAGLCAEIISYRGRSAVRDVGKAMGLSLDMVDSMAKRLDWWHRGVLSDQQVRDAGLDPADATVRRVLELSTQLLGFPRHLGQHVGGMVMTRGSLCEMVPIENAAMTDRTVIEWDKDDIDTVGLLKVDCLALGMLTAISKAMKLIHAYAGRRYELHTIPRECPDVYDMICDADTVGVFQIESRAQMSMLPRLRPRKFYDLVIEVAIVRPGPIQGKMVHPYLRRRNGQEKVEYPSEALREVLSRTLGVPLFQEQAMKVAMVGAGFSAEEADKLRRAMAAWRKNGRILEFREKIMTGMIRNGYTERFADQTFEQLKGFGEYGFPESHSASFAILVYASAWIKRHHPAAFGAAILNSQPMGFYAPAQLVRDAREHGVCVREVDVNFSSWDCTLESGNHNDQTQDTRGLPKEAWGQGGPALRLGLRLIKGMREVDAARITAERARAGLFDSIPRFHRRTGVSTASVKRLAEADAFASLGLSRRQASWEALSLRDDDAPLFDALDDPIDDHDHEDLTPAPAAPYLPAMSTGQEVMTDYAVTGLSLKQHPMSLVRPALQKLRIVSARQMNALSSRRWVKVAGLVLVRQRPGTASGIVFVTLEDETGIVNLIIRPDVYERYRPAARYAGLLQADGYVEKQGKVVHVMAKRLFDLSDMLHGLRSESRDFH